MKLDGSRGCYGDAQPNDDQLTALKAYAEKYGSGWKSSLSTAWMTGKDCNEPDGHLLRQLRNRFGPSWLVKFNLEEAA